jgi:hypothetical protein
MAMHAGGDLSHDSTSFAMNTTGVRGGTGFFAGNAPMDDRSDDGTRVRAEAQCAKGASRR